MNAVIKGRVLAVDDCPTTLALVSASLERLGYSVQAVDSGEAALQAAADAECFDAVILDVELPGLDGMAVGQALRSNPRTAATMIAMHSSVEEATVRRHFTQYDAFCPKAAHPALLGERVHSLLQARRA